MGTAPLPLLRDVAPSDRPALRDLLRPVYRAGTTYAVAHGHLRDARGRGLGYAAVQFNCVVSTKPAVGLWSSLGFAVVGRVPAAFDHADVGLVVLW